MWDPKQIIYCRTFLCTVHANLDQKVVVADRSENVLCEVPSKNSCQSKIATILKFYAILKVRVIQNTTS